MKQKHTESPWRPHDAEPLTIVGPDGRAIALFGSNREYDENEANFRLAIASPELLKAVQHLLNAANAVKADYRPPFFAPLEESVLMLIHASENARSAISKAKGEPQ